MDQFRNLRGIVKFSSYTLHKVREALKTIRLPHVWDAIYFDSDR